MRVNTLQVTECSDALSERTPKILGKRTICTTNRRVWSRDRNVLGRGSEIHFSPALRLRLQLTVRQTQCKIRVCWFWTGFVLAAVDNSDTFLPSKPLQSCSSRAPLDPANIHCSLSVPWSCKKAPRQKRILCFVGLEGILGNVGLSGRQCRFLKVLFSKRKCQMINGYWDTAMTWKHSRFSYNAADNLKILGQEGFHGCRDFWGSSQNIKYLLLMDFSWLEAYISGYRKKPFHWFQGILLQNASQGRT